MTLVSPRQWASGDDEASRSPWARRTADDLFSELLDELAAELLADDESTDSTPHVGAADADTDTADPDTADADTAPASLINPDRVEFVADAAQPASQIFVDDQRRGRRLVSIILTMLKLAVMIYAIVVAFGFMDLLGR